MGSNRTPAGPPPSWSVEERKGFLGPHPGSSGPHPGSWGPHPGAVGPPPVHIQCKGPTGQGAGKGQGVRSGRTMTHAMHAMWQQGVAGGGREGVGGQERGSRPGTPTGVGGPRFLVFSARGRAASRTCEVKGR